MLGIMQVMDLGSLNGTSLNGRIISTSNRRRSRLWRLNDGDEIKLGVRSTLKITYLPLQDVRVRAFPLLIFVCAMRWRCRVEVLRVAAQGLRMGGTLHVHPRPPEDICRSSICGS